MKSEYENGFIAGIAQEKETQMNLSKYNGWQNYATWRVNLEMFDGFNPADWNDDWQIDQVIDLADYMQETAINLIEQSCTGRGGFALDYAMAFLDDVNWYEIAKHKMEEYQNA